MIGLLRGILHKYADNSAIIDVNGTGYEITMPETEFAALEERQETTVYTHLAVRDDALNLYAFTTPESRQMFRMLTEVSGVGPKAAMNILSVFSTGQLLDILSEGRENSLQSVHGIGKKTAARLCVDLKERASKLRNTISLAGSQGTETSVRSTDKENSISTDLFSALINLGYRPSETERAVAEAMAMLSDNEKQDFGIMLKASLKILAGYGGKEV